MSHMFYLRFAVGGEFVKSYRFDLDKTPKTVTDFILAFTGHADVAAHARKLNDRELFDQIIRAGSDLFPIPWDRYTRDRFHNYIVEYYRRRHYIDSELPGHTIAYDTLLMGPEDAFDTSCEQPDGLNARSAEDEHDLAVALDSYTDPQHPDYDPEFDRKIRALRPDWFDGQDEESTQIANSPSLKKRGA